MNSISASPLHDPVLRRLYTWLYHCLLMHAWFTCTWNHTVQPLAPSYLKQGHLMDVIKPVYKDPGININLKCSQSNQVIKIRHWNNLREFNYWILRLAKSHNYHLKKILRHALSEGSMKGQLRKPINSRTVFPEHKTDIAHCIQGNQCFPLSSLCLVSISPCCITTKLSVCK